jgi:class 3 adenylate cyclase
MHHPMSDERQEPKTGEEKKDPLSKIRHDLRTPINQIIGYSELLKEEAEDEGLDSMVDDLGRIGGAARRLLELLEAAFANPAALDAMQRTAEASGPDGAAQDELKAAVTSQLLESRSGDEVVDAHAAESWLLVVDDNDLNRDMLARRLSSAGYQVDTADSGKAALAKIDTGQFDLLLLDVIMPGLSGIDVLKILREKSGVADLPVIMATALDESHMIVEALKLGANDYVTKPLDFPVVLARVRTQLQLKKAKDEVQRLAEELSIRNRFIRDTFGRYLSDEIVESLLETPEGLDLGGAKRQVSIMMTDVRGFTSLCERLAPEAVVRMLNNFLGGMAEVIIKYNGTIDEFIGDAILAIFGAPILRENDAARAVACAVEMQLAMDQVNAVNDAEGLPRIEMGIAINTGEVVVGNIGSEARAKYGVVGSPVNLTARIESYSIGGQILISESTLERIRDIAEVGAAIEISAKGLATPMKAYDLKAIGGEWNLRLPERVETYQDLPEPIPARFALLEGKHVGELDNEGEIVSLSQRGGWMTTRASLAELTNLKMRVIGRAEIPTDLYAKVVQAGAGRVELRFTSTPPEVASFFKGVLDKISR